MAESYRPAGPVPLPACGTQRYLPTGAARSLTLRRELRPAVHYPGLPAAPPAGDLGDLVELGPAGDQLAVAEPLAGLQVPAKVETVGADRVDGPSGDHQRHALASLRHARVRDQPGALSAQ